MSYSWDDPRSDNPGVNAEQRLRDAVARTVDTDHPVAWPAVRRSCGHVDDKNGWSEELRELFEKTVCAACARGGVLRANAPAPVTLAELLSRLDSLVALARHGRFELFAVVLEREGKLVRAHEPAFTQHQDPSDHIAF